VNPRRPHDVSLRVEALGADALDADTVDRARAGEPEAFEAVWRWLSPAVLGYLRGHGATEAEDLTSDVFLGVFKRIRQFDGDAAALRTFVFSVAHARLVDSYRRSSSRPTPRSYAPELDPRTSPSAESEALGAASRERALRMLDRLSDDQRDVITLRLIADLSVEETASVLGKRVGAVKSLQHRAVDALKRHLDPAVTS
jgi:RNA polymerase sigma-70 factor (ECF subfamily)